jgi:hypothetical protein
LRFCLRVRAAFSGISRPGPRRASRPANPWCARASHGLPLVLPPSRQMTRARAVRPLDEGRNARRPRNVAAVVAVKNDQGARRRRSASARADCSGAFRLRRRLQQTSLRIRIRTDRPRLPPSRPAPVQAGPASSRSRSTASPARHRAPRVSAKGRSSAWSAC